MGFPSDSRSLVGETPRDDPSVRISGQEPAVSVSEAEGVDLTGVASEHVGRLGRRETFGSHRLVCVRYLMLSSSYNRLI